MGYHSGIERLLVQWKRNNIRRRHDVAQSVIVSVVVGGEFWKFYAMQQIKVHGENYDLILGISTYYI